MGTEKKTRRELRRERRSRRRELRRGALRHKMREEPGAFWTYVILRTIVILILIRSLMRGEFESSVVCLFVLFIYVLPQFVEPERGHPTLQILSLGGLYELACLIVFTAIAALGGRMATWFNRSDRAQMLMNRIAGCIFLGLALMLAFASR